jgi:Zn-dependent metalloprotease
MCTRNPLHCIVPPHVLEKIAENGDEAQRRWARQTLITSEQIRGMRMVLSQGAVALATGQRQRAVYTAAQGFTLPGTLVRQEGQTQPSGDAAVDEAFDGLGDTYDFYEASFQRNSLDNAGLRLTGTVHYATDYSNAFWDGRQMVFGDGDGQLFQRFTRSLDVIAHELTHGVVEHTANLAYWDEHGALNESMADVFGSLVRQWKRGESADQADWLIGSELLAAGVQGRALRSLAAPGTAYNDPVLGRDPQPAHMTDFVVTNEDNGGVHINSGIPNHAFYVAARELGGYAWEKAGRIWYVALSTRLQRKSTFQDAVNLTTAVAGELYGPGSVEQQAVKKGWAEVGLQPTVPVLKLFEEPAGVEAAV